MTTDATELPIVAGKNRNGVRIINVGTIGHIDHGKKIVNALALLAMRSAPLELPECYLKEKNNEPYYRRFEKKKR